MLYRTARSAEGVVYLGLHAAEAALVLAWRAVRPPVRLPRSAPLWRDRGR